ncbi:hypothetical protein [Luteithermobacter gelatinilyticus]|uniref:hypothetical protein n=1 Tax=Luteithermobacter gelatinilyticus TaxID=2582913 RepID=UPI001105BE02|nr:hypothetical protein [Luteithermobacter gelatinilyticus]|tara:strand:- start:6086 stop:6310 length:225 start_codon:yes stop_codon:yes gene_type:complete
MEFLGDIAFMVDVAVLASGLIVLHFAQKENSSLMKWAAWVMIVTGTLAAICTGAYWAYYYFEGVYDVQHMMPHR